LAEFRSIAIELSGIEVAKKGSRKLVYGLLGLIGMGGIAVVLSGGDEPKIIDEEPDLPRPPSPD